MARAHKCQSQNSYGLITYPFSLTHCLFRRDASRLCSVRGFDAMSRIETNSLSVETRGIRDARHRVSTVKITDNAVVVEWCHPSKY